LRKIEEYSQSGTLFAFYNLINVIQTIPFKQISIINLKEIGIRCETLFHWDFSTDRIAGITISTNSPTEVTIKEIRFCFDPVLSEDHRSCFRVVFSPLGEAAFLPCRVWGRA